MVRKQGGKAEYVEPTPLQFLYPTDLLVDVSAFKPLFKLPGLTHAWGL